VVSEKADRPARVPVDGPTLRAVRENTGTPLRRIARSAGMSHGHLSKVERGEHGRPVTPAIVTAYERVTGVRLDEAAAKVAERRLREAGRDAKVWVPGQMTDPRRVGYNAAIGALAVGGFLGEPVGRLIDSAGRPAIPPVPDQWDLVQLAQTCQLLTGLDMRYGGGLVAQLGKAVLGWAVPMLNAREMDEPDATGLHAVLAAIAHRAGWAAFDVAAHESARSLFRLALSAAVRGEDHDLRGHVLADVAAQHNQLGYHHDALQLIRLGEGDERISPPVRMVLHGVKARVYGALGQVEPCRQQIQAAQAAFDQPNIPQRAGWVDRIATPARLDAMAGHAIAELATRTGDDSHRGEAIQRLTRAVDGFDPAVHARAHALCLARIGLLQATGGGQHDSDQFAQWIRERLPDHDRIRSQRLAAAIQTTQPQQPGPAAQPAVARQRG
jgi:transcriptional regulator with XRE-family HTH domain